MSGISVIKFNVAVMLMVLLGGCQSAYYSAWEKLGVYKRDILVDRVEDVRDTQQETKEQFQTALEKFTAVTNFDGGDLEKRYKTLNAAYEDSDAKAQEIRKRIDAVEDVAGALFDEWEDELAQYSSASLKRSSQQKLNATRAKYKRLLQSMKRAEAKIEPVLSVFRDQTLFLKHNLNAQAITSLKSELAGVKTDVSALIREMQKSIDASDSFIKSLQDG